MTHLDTLASTVINNLHHYSTTMVTSTDKLIANFPHPTVDPIEGVPTYATIAALNLQLNVNASSITSHLGDGKHGLLALTITPEVYATISDVLFEAPMNPGPNTPLPDNATQHQIIESNRQHDECQRIWMQFTTTDNILRQQLIGAIDNIYLRAKSNVHTGYANIPTLELLTHLYNVYGNIQDHDLIKNDQEMKKAYDPNLPIEVLFDQIDRGIDFAAAGKSPYTNNQILYIAVNLIQTTGVFPEAYREWNRKVDEDKTYARFKQFMATAHLEFRQSQLTSGRNHFAACVVEQKEAIANLAAATDIDRTLLSQLTTTIQSLAEEVSKLKGEKKNNTITVYKRFKNNNYFWSHGYDITENHTSATCRFKNDGHIDSATHQDNQGGKQYNKFKQPHPPNPSSSWLPMTSSQLKTGHTPPSTLSVADSGCSGHYIRLSTPHNNKTFTTNGIIVQLPNG